MTEKSDVKTVRVFNRGIRTYNTKSGKLTPQTVLEVSPAEAKILLNSHDVIDASKMVKVGPDHAETKVKLAKAEAANAELAKANKELQEKHDDLQEALKKEKAKK